MTKKMNVTTAGDGTKAFEATDGIFENQKSRNNRKFFRVIDGPAERSIVLTFPLEWVEVVMTAETIAELGFPEGVFRVGEVVRIPGKTFSQEFPTIRNRVELDAQPATPSDGLFHGALIGESHKFPGHEERLAHWTAVHAGMVEKIRQSGQSGMPVEDDE
jgi:hypothetical protein